MATNKIVKLKLENRAVKLREHGKTLDEIALILSDDSKHNISKSNVFRFFDSYERTKAQIIEKQEPLKVRYVEADISTIEKRLSMIEKLEESFLTCESKTETCMISREIREHLDSLDKRLGKWINAVNIDNSKTENTYSVVLHLPRKDIP